MRAVYEIFLHIWAWGLNPTGGTITLADQYAVARQPQPREPCNNLTLLLFKYCFSTFAFPRLFSSSRFPLSLVTLDLGGIRSQERWVFSLKQHFTGNAEYSITAGTFASPPKANQAATNTSAQGSLRSTEIVKTPGKKTSFILVYIHLASAALSKKQEIYRETVSKRTS